jgi:hypothetical protein
VNLKRKREKVSVKDFCPIRAPTAYSYREKKKKRKTLKAMHMPPMATVLTPSPSPSLFLGSPIKKL